MPGPEPRRRGLLDAVLVPGPRVQRRHAVDGLRAALGGAALAATALLASTHEVSGAERSVFEAVNRLPQTVAPALWAVMQAGSLPAVFVTAGLALAARRPRLAVALAGGGTTTWLLAKLIKQAVDRGRPEELLRDVIVYGPSATGLGFPSGHAAVAATLMTVAQPYLTGPARIVGWIAVALVAFTRVYVGAHLPLDAAGGLLLGWAVGSLVNLLLSTPD